jgi:hypothetical protein
MRHFRYSIIVTGICLVLAYRWGAGTAEGGMVALGIAFMLGIMEVSLSFDNAVVNASVLKEMDEKWRHMFLTVGILVAVFGMRLLLPILIVSVATGEGFTLVAKMAINQPDEYAQHLMDAHAGIASFGGMFLLLVFLSFLFDEGKELHWLGKVEEALAKVGKLDSVGIIFALGLLLLVQSLIPLPMETRVAILTAGIGGVLLYVVVDSLGNLLGGDDNADLGTTAKRSGVMGFLYLEVLDASFSFDGVIGAFAVTRDVVVIMLGLAIGAMFVRSLTVYLVEKGTLDEYVFLEHGAHYAIGALALIMFASIVSHVSEIVTGLVGVGFIAAALLSSLVYKKTQEISEGT